MIVKLQSSRRLVASSKGEVFQGEFCEENVRISDALFPGQHSWMSVDLVTAVRSDTIPGVFYFDIVKIELLYLAIFTPPGSTPTSRWS